MNITALTNPLIDNPQEINSSNVANRSSISIIPSESCVRLTVHSLISVGSLSSYMFLSKPYPITSLICVALSSYGIYIADGLITRMYNNDSSANQETNNGLANLNNQQVRSVSQMIRGSRGPFKTMAKTKTRDLNISYNELTELPSGYHYNDADTCNITLEPLVQGDVVCCDTYLYSFKALKQYYEKYMGNVIPHNRQHLDWNKVYKLPRYGVAPAS